MTRKQLRDSARARLDDLVGSDSSRMWPDAELNDYLEESAEEMAAECLLITDSLTASICTIPLVQDQSHYALSRKIIKIDEIRPSWTTTPVARSASFRAFAPTWQSDKGCPTGYALDYSSGYLSFNKSLAVANGESVSLTVKRLPLVAMTDATSPEFDDQHHRKLVAFVLHRAFSKPDSETRNMELSTRFLREWLEALGEVKSREARLRPNVYVASRVEM